ncbi:MAG: hypothetical protein MJA83_15850 [Gammaproteobacteria bacterium]|nr:hypothetical protein [Gammaproteobacteria bacterium]
MTLLKICQNVAEESGFAKPSTIVSNTDKVAVRLFRAANRAGRVLAKLNWTVLQDEHTFSTVASTAAYALPSDFARFNGEAQWNRTNKDRVFGPTSPEDWQAIKSGFVTSTIDDRFRVKVDSGTRKFFIDPTPSAVETIAYEYISNNWCQSSGETGQDDWAADADTGRIDEELLELETLWRFKLAMGLDPSVEAANAKRIIEMEFARDGGLKTVRMDKSNKLRLVANIPETNVGI